MMDHEKVRDLFSEYMEDDLGPELRDQVREHLDECEECREEYDAFRQTFETFRSLPVLDPPRDLDSRIKKRIRARSRGKFFSATSAPHVVHRVPYEFISLILILIALFCLYLMTMVSGVEKQPEPREERDPGSQVQERQEGEDGAVPDHPENQ